MENGDYFYVITIAAGSIPGTVFNTSQTGIISVNNHTRFEVAQTLFDRVLEQARERGYEGSAESISTTFLTIEPN